MAYPTIIRMGDECIARATVDGRFSVRWDHVVHHAYVTPDGDNRAVIGFCRLLLAARDNFVTCAWNDPQAAIEADAWDGDSAEIYNTSLVANEPVFSFNVGRRVARINWDLTWSVRWSLIEGLKVNEIELLKLNPAIGSLVTLMLAAKDNFVCTPW